jgi:hypothetical protein
MFGLSHREKNDVLLPFLYITDPLSSHQLMPCANDTTNPEHLNPVVILVSFCSSAVNVMHVLT